MNRPLVVAITGASGAPYAVRLVECLLEADRRIHLTISDSGREVIRQELGRQVERHSFRLEDLLGRPSLPAGWADRVAYHDHGDFLAPIASGSDLTDGMVICPCSGTTLSAVVNAASGNLIQRAAEVHLKERRKLILVPRETPLSLPQLENMRRVTLAGAIVLPASPGFYHGAQSMQDLVDFVVARILDQLGVDHQLMRRWGAED